MKKITHLALLVAGISMGTFAQAQVNILKSDVSLQFPGAASVALHIGATNRTVIPTPFLIAGQEAESRAWFCMDPLQNIYYGGASATIIHYASTNPTDFDIWNPSSPGLSTARVQNLADLFNTYWPVTDTVLNSAALQLAVWEIANEFTGNGFDLTTGAFTATNNAGAIALATTFLNSLDDLGIQGVGNTNGLSFLIDGTLSPGGNLVQDLVGWDPRTPPNLIPVPEPSTYGACAALGLVGIAALRRRRARALARS